MDSSYTPFVCVFGLFSISIIIYFLSLFLLLFPCPGWKGWGKVVRGWIGLGWVWVEDGGCAAMGPRDLTAALGSLLGLVSLHRTAPRLAERRPATGMDR